MTALFKKSTSEKSLAEVRESMARSIGSPNPENLRIFKVSKKVRDLEELLEDHDEVEGPVLFAGLSARVKKTRFQALMQLIARQKLVSIVPLELNNMPLIELEETVYELSIADMLPAGGHKEIMKRCQSSGCNYLTVEEFVFNYLPLTSAEDPFAKVTLKLVDARNPFSLEKQVIEGPSNCFFDGRMMVDYFVHIKNFDKLRIRIELAHPILEEGTIWGTIQTYVMIKMSKRPSAIALEPVVGNIGFTETQLQNNKHSLKHVSLFPNDNALELARDLASKGMIIDRRDPDKSSKKIKSSASAIGSDDGSVVGISTQRAKQISDYNRRVQEEMAASRSDVEIGNSPGPSILEIDQEQPKGEDSNVAPYAMDVEEEIAAAEETYQMAPAPESSGKGKRVARFVDPRLSK